MFTSKTKTFFLVSLLGSVFSVSAQFNADFEAVSLNGQGFNNGSNLQGGYISADLFFKNGYDTQFQSWFGFGASSVNDSTTEGYNNQYGCYAGGGANGSQKFGVAYLSTFPSVRYPTIRKSAGSASPTLVSFQYTNNTYAGLSMKNGDAVAKKFGGITGNDPDFYKMIVSNHYNGQVTGTAEIYLADFRFANNSQDYIVKGWRTATFNFPTPFDSLTFDLQSSDNGTFGMNTPAYFCIDDLTFDVVTEIESELTSGISISPNPVLNQLTISGLKEGPEISITDLTGRTIEFTSATELHGIKLEISTIPAGIYQIRSNGRFLGRFVKN